MQVSISPTHDLVLGDPSIPGNVQMFFASDGRLYAVPSETVLNLWNVLVAHWPEVLGPVVGLLALFAIWRLIRVSRTPRNAGSSYCRRCNYEVAESMALCPECGVDLSKSRAVQGQTKWRRLVVPLGIALVALIGYGLMFVPPVSREVNSTYGWFSWSNSAITKLARDHQINWLLEHEGTQSTLVELDVNTGKTLRIVRCVSYSCLFQPSPSPDGRCVVTTLENGNLAAIELSTGRIVREQGSLDVAGPTGLSRWLHVIGWTSSHEVWVQFLDQTGQSHKAYKWDIASGALQEGADIPTTRDARYGNQSARLMYLIPRSNPALAWEIHDRYNESPGHGGQSTIRIRNLADGKTTTEFTGWFWVSCAPVTRADGKTFFVHGVKGVELHETDGDLIGSLENPGFVGTLQDGPCGLAVHEGTRRLFVTTTDGLFVRDIESRIWVAQLTLGKDALPDDYVHVSPDGRWVAIGITDAVGMSAALSALPSFYRHVLIFDLSKLPSNSEIVK